MICYQLQHVQSMLPLTLYCLLLGLHNLMAFFETVPVDMGINSPRKHQPLPMFHLCAFYSTLRNSIVLLVLMVYADETLLTSDEKTNKMDFGRLVTI